MLTPQQIFRSNKTNYANFLSKTKIENQNFGFGRKFVAKIGQLPRMLGADHMQQGGGGEGTALSAWEEEKEPSERKGTQPVGFSFQEPSAQGMSR